MVKKWFASILAVMITAAGFTIVDRALVERVDMLERQVSSMQDVLNAAANTPTKGTATVNIGYSVSGYETGSICMTVTEGDAISLDMVENAVRGQLSAKYEIHDVDVRSGSAVSAAEPITYTFTVIVDADEK